MGLPASHVSVALEELSCGECGIVFAVPARWLEEKRENGGRFSCPNGHGRIFRESECDRLRKELAQEKDAAAWHRRRAEGIDRQLTAARGQMTKLRNRIQRGVCPDCKRSFQNLRRHMETKHPTLALPPP